VTTQLQHKSVFAPVTALFFQAHQLDECRAFLVRRATHTESVPVGDESQLVLKADGRLRENNYRYNPIGFDALSRALSPGLTALFNDLSGEVTRKIVDTDNLAADIAAAVSIYNTTLHARFELLRERTLLVNHQEKAVEGFLGLDHRMLHNSDFLDIVCAAIKDQQDSARFYRAEIVGRELRVYFIDDESRRNDLHPDSQHTFAAGWYFSNREDVGQAIRGSVCLYTKFGVALEAPSAKSKVVHTGADLTGRTTALAVYVSKRNVDMGLVGAQVKKLLSTNLGYSDKKAEQDSAIKNWSRYLTQLKVRGDTAMAVCKNAATVGADLTPRDLIEAYTRAALASRTTYDLACSMLRYAKNEYGAYKDVLQTAAMKMFVPEKSHK
jgi:hypothetical protein